MGKVLERHREAPKRGDEVCETKSRTSGVLLVGTGNMTDTRGEKVRNLPGRSEGSGFPPRRRWGKESPESPEKAGNSTTPGLGSQKEGGGDLAEIRWVG